MSFDSEILTVPPTKDTPNSPYNCAPIVYSVGHMTGFEFVKIDSNLPKPIKFYELELYSIINSYPSSTTSSSNSQLTFIRVSVLNAF